MGGRLVEQRSIGAEAGFELDLPVGDCSAPALDAVVRRVLLAFEVQRAGLGDDVPDRRTQGGQAHEVCFGRCLRLDG